MKMLIITFMILFSAYLAKEAKARDIEYVGNGRYTCTGGGCSDFNAQQRRFNDAAENAERQYREAQRLREKYELDRKLEAIERKYEQRNSSN